MGFQQELSSWLFAPSAPKTQPVPQPGTPAPQTTKIPLPPNKPVIIAFLRHCGCPFAEKTFSQMRTAAKSHTDVDFIAVSHSDQASTDKWLKSLPGGTELPTNLRLVVDEKLEGYAAWGLGASGIYHLFGAIPSVSTVAKEGFDVRPTESGSRWQTSGTYAVGADGKVKFGGPAKRADDVPDFEEYVKQASS